jgi:ATP-dependent helicase Lhr and Lhr-like helicase
VSVTSAFDRLHPALQHHIVNTLGWSDLRELQQEATEPILRGDDALLLAPTAGGKTEAALFPLLTRMAEAGWPATSVLYICPLRALLNNLEPRVSAYTAWLGRSAAIRHGDTKQSDRRRQAREHPDVLLTTPESLESMLVSAVVDPRVLLANIRAVVVDEIHAFAGDDRGWHLLALLARISALTGRPLQRVGLSATVGNAADLLTWLQGGTGNRGAVVSPAAKQAATAEVEVDYVGSLTNAASVIAGLHRGEKRLVFAETRAGVESLATLLRELSVETYVSHSSLAVDERRRAELAFAEARDCVIVSTSTLELGIDVGDLDRVIQVGAPQTVASLLQRLGRTGRRRGSSSYMLFLATTDDELIASAALTLLWGEGYVEPVVAPPSPRHLAAQQLLALALQEHQVGRDTWAAVLEGLDLASAEELTEITDWMLSTGHLDHDSGMVFVGPAAERRFGHRHFLELLSIFTSAPQFAVLHGRREIGTVDPFVLIRKVAGPRVISLAGRGWSVSAVDWSRRRAYVEPAETRGDARWISVAQPQSYAFVDAQRRVLLGHEPTATRLSRRAQEQLPKVRAEYADRVDHDHTLLRAEGARTRWWTWAGGRGNAILTAALETVDRTLVDDDYVYDNRQIGLRTSVTAAELRRAVHAVQAQLANLDGVRPFVTERALQQLKFAELLPPDLARRTMEERLSDPAAAAVVLDRPIATAG